MKAMVDLNPRSFFLLQFIDKTYGEHFKKQDFKDGKAMIDYILDKENQNQLDSFRTQCYRKVIDVALLRLDTLASLCFNYNASEKKDADIYRLYRSALAHPDFISPTERTLAQLKNSGAMRLIRKKAVIDSIVLYDDLAKKLADQQVYYERYQNESVQSSFQLINFSYYNLGSPITGNLHLYDSARLLSTDKLELIEFGNGINVYEGVVAFYNNRLQETEEHAITLIKTLKTQYHLENR